MGFEWPDRGNQSHPTSPAVAARNATARLLLARWDDGGLDPDWTCPSVHHRLAFFVPTLAAGRLVRSIPCAPCPRSIDRIIASHRIASHRIADPSNACSSSSSVCVAVLCVGRWHWRWYILHHRTPARRPSHGLIDLGCLRRPDPMPRRGTHSLPLLLIRNEDAMRCDATGGGPTARRRYPIPIHGPRPDLSFFWWWSYYLPTGYSWLVGRSNRHLHYTSTYTNIWYNTYRIRGYALSQKKTH